MLLSVLDLGETTVDDVMVPRQEILGIDLDEPWKETLLLIKNSQHTCLPVFQGDVDNIKGLVRISNILEELSRGTLDEPRLLENLEEPYFVPEGTPLNKQLFSFQNLKNKFAFVVDEYGDVQGLITTEDIVREIVGEFGADPQNKNHVSDWMLEHADKDPSNWLHYGKDYESTRYVQAEQINRSNVKSLVPKWQVSFGKLEGQDSQGVGVNGTVFVTTSFNRVISIDGRNGDIDWVYTRDLPADVFPQLCCDVVNRGVAPYGDKVYLATLDAHIVALNNATGAVEFDVMVGDYTYAETMTIMPMALEGKLIVCLLYTSPSPRALSTSRMPSSA